MATGAPHLGGWGGGRIHVTVGNGPDGPTRTVVLDRDGHPAVGGSGELGMWVTDQCVGIEGSCEVPIAPLIGPDGTTFVVGAYFNGTTAVGLSPSGQIMAGWPYRSDVGHQGVGICDPDDICEGYSLATPAISPANVLYLLNAAASESVGGTVVAIGADGQVRPGWPVVLRRPGAAFWSVVVGSDGTAYVLAIEPEAGDASSASILSIAPDSTVIHSTTIIDR